MQPGRPLPTFEAYVNERSEEVAVPAYDPKERLHMRILNSMGSTMKERISTKGAIIPDLVANGPAAVRAKIVQIAGLPAGTSFDVLLPHGDRYRFETPR